jgi:glycosyltransferase involved in cell wall biosynthesis
MSELPLISVIIPTKNRRSCLSALIGDLRVQTCSAWEAWIVDDHSSDGTGEWLREVAAEEVRVKVLELPEGKSGACAARNAGAARARGEWLLFFDSDDRLRPETLAERLAEATGGAPSVEVDLLLSRGAPFTETPGDLPLPETLPLTAEHLLASRAVYQTGGFFWRSEAYERLGGWDESLAMWQDVDLLLRALPELKWRVSTRGPDFEICRGRPDSICQEGFFSAEKLRARLRVLEKQTAPGSWASPEAWRDGLLRLADQSRRAHQWAVHDEVITLGKRSRRLRSGDLTHLRWRALRTRLRLPVVPYSSPSS